MPLPEILKRQRPITFPIQNRGRALSSEFSPHYPRISWQGDTLQNLHGDGANFAVLVLASGFHDFFNYNVIALAHNLHEHVYHFKFQERTTVWRNMAFMQLVATTCNLCLRMYICYCFSLNMYVIILANACILYMPSLDMSIISVVYA